MAAAAAAAAKAITAAFATSAAPLAARAPTTVAPPGTSVEEWAAALGAPRSAGAPPLVASTPAAMRAARAAMDAVTWRRTDSGGRAARVGFVPTMGALHAGHLALVDAARAPVLAGRAAPPSDFVVASIFVNPTQFAPTEDLATSPRTWEADVAALAAKGVAVLYAPTAASMYPPPALRSSTGGVPAYRTYVEVAEVDARSPEGGARPGHMRGVATVVTKLLAAVAPTTAVFGQKDGVQAVVVRTLARDLNLPVDIIVAPTARAPHGLALSSRHAYLTPGQRAAPPALYPAPNPVATALHDSPKGRAVLAASRAARAAALDAARSGAGSAGSTGGDLAAAKEAQAAAVEARAAAARAPAGADATAAHTPATPLAPYLASLLEEARAIILASGGADGSTTLPAPADRFSEVQYLTLSDAATGVPLARLEDSTARGGAVMLSAAARIGTTRLLDNIMLVGDVDDLGVPEVL